ncbi:MAG: alpha/beta hydrolase [Elusimicrobia bacterium]|nr:alpha/beta hydrolase [Elusimicrobiota bacterium]
MPGMRQTVLVIALLVAGWVGLRRFETANIYHPARDFTVIPRTFGLSHEEVALRAEDGVALHGWFLPAAGGPLAAQRLVLLYCHGNAGNVSSRVPKADLFHRLGLSVLLFDYRGYGKSAGSPSEQGTYRDAEAAWRWLTQAKRYPPDRLVIYGESLGNGIALETALRHPPKALILESAFTSIVDMGREVFPWLPVRLMVTMRYDNLAKIPRIQCPVLVMHSRQDRVVPFRMGQALFAAAPQPKEFLEMTGGHDEGYLETGAAYPKAVQAFLLRRVAPKK